jgi:hypothetical protein
MLEAFKSPIEIDESYFAGNRKGIRGKGVTERLLFSAF